MQESEKNDKFLEWGILPNGYDFCHVYKRRHDVKWNHLVYRANKVKISQKIQNGDKKIDNKSKIQSKDIFVYTRSICITVIKWDKKSMKIQSEEEINKLISEMQQVELLTSFLQHMYTCLL